MENSKSNGQENKEEESVGIFVIIKAVYHYKKKNNGEKNRDSIY